MLKCQGKFLGTPPSDCPGTTPSPSHRVERRQQQRWSVSWDWEYKCAQEMITFEHSGKRWGVHPLPGGLPASWAGGNRGWRGGGGDQWKFAWWWRRRGRRRRRKKLEKKEEQWWRLIFCVVWNELNVSLLCCSIHFIWKYKWKLIQTRVIYVNANISYIVRIVL